MNMRTTFEVRSFTSSWDNRGIQRIWAVPGYAEFSPKFLMGFCSDGPVNDPAKVEVRSLTSYWDNWGYPIIWAVPGYAHAPFSPNF